jgi:hypothetical protein
MNLFFSKTLDWFKGMTNPEMVQLVITIFVIFLGLLRTFFRINIFGNKLLMAFFIIRTIIIIFWYFIFRKIMKELQKHGYNKLAWVIAFQPLIDRVLLMFTGYSLIIISHQLINKIM